MNYQHPSYCQCSQCYEQRSIAQRYAQGPQADKSPTLRDQFAMAALTGMLANTRCTSGEIVLTGLVALAYEYADTALKAREANNEP